MNSARLFVIIDMLLWSTLGVLRRYVYLPSGVIALVRGLLGSAFLISVVYLVYGKFHWDQVRKNLLPLVIGGILLGTNWAFLFEAYRYTQVGIAEIFYFTNTVFIILLAPFITKERITLSQWLCVLIALGGMVLVSGAYKLTISTKDALGIGFAIIAALESTGVVFSGKVLKGLPDVEVAAIQLTLSGLILIPYTFFTGELMNIQLGFDLSTMITCLMGLLHTGVAYVFFFAALPKIPSAEYTILSYIDPIFAIVWGWLLLGETLNIPQIIGAVLIIGSLMYSELAKK